MTNVIVKIRTLRLNVRYRCLMPIFADVIDWPTFSVIDFIGFFVNDLLDDDE